MYIRFEEPHIVLCSNISNSTSHIVQEVYNKCIVIVMVIAIVIVTWLL